MLWVKIAWNVNATNNIINDLITVVETNFTDFYQK